MLKISNLGLIIIFLLSCNSMDNTWYKIEREVFLSSELEEISGLTYYEKGKLFAIQDEDGVLFTLDEKSGEIIDTEKFGKKGDYEGIARVKDHVYILVSNGDLIAYNLRLKTSKKIKNSFSKDFEFEGLCFEESKNRLILACKTAPKKSMNKHLLFYGFNLSTMQLMPEPIYSLDKDLISEHAISKISNIKSSGIIQHPVSQKFFVLASQGHSIITLTPSFKIEKVTQFYDDFKQPEGVCINSKGQLIISNEGKGKSKANLKTITIK